MQMILCPYCRSPASLVTGKTIYPYSKTLRDMKFWSCKPCDAYVGCHPGTENPLGSLANYPLRRARNRAHAAFDPLWKTKKMKRGEAYAFLAAKLNVPKNECHIGVFDEEQCARVVQISVRKMSEMRNAH